MGDKYAHVRRLNSDEVIPFLPQVEPWDESLSNPIDIFITSLGFEDRAAAIAKTIAHNLAGTDIPRTALGIICCYNTNRSDNERNRELISTALAAFCSRQVDIDAYAPQEIEHFLGEQITELTKAHSPINIIFDISTASGNLILSIMHTLLRFRDSLTLKILYSEPARYFPSREEYEASPDVLVLRACDTGDADSSHEYGVNDVQINELYPGVDGENRPEFVIAVPALRTGRMLRCLQHISDQPLSAPDKFVFWILSEPPASDLKWRHDFQKRIIKNAMSTMVGFSPLDPLAPQLRQDNHITCSTRDYRDILKVVLEESDRRLGHNLSIVHMGSKLQAVGISLALSVRSEIAVCFAQPIQFNPSQYSAGVGSMWKIDLTNLNEIAANLEKIGQLVLTAKIETNRTGIPSM